jgi:hypothetical protein
VASGISGKSDTAHAGLSSAPWVACFHRAGFPLASGTSPFGILKRRGCFINSLWKGSSSGREWSLVNRWRMSRIHAGRS